jgi:hypothetical protein
MEGIKGLRWRKASASGANGGNCIEVATLPSGSHLVRDSKDPDGPRLPVNSGHWRAFVRQARTGTFSHSS